MSSVNSDSEPFPSHLPQSTDKTDVTNLFRKATDRALVFLSNASNGNIGACLVGLGATTYFVFGRVGLVLIGVVGGVVLHAHWEAGGGGQDAQADVLETNRRREAGVFIAERVLNWHTSRKEKSSSNVDDDFFTRPAEYSDFPPNTAAALNILTDTVVKDYVKWWYSPILPAEIAFPSACRQTLSNFLLGVAHNVSRKRPADSFLEFTTNSSSIIIVFFSELSSALSASPSSKPHDALKTYLRLKPESNLANLIDQKTQQRKLRMIADDVLEKYLDSNVYRCGPARIFLREMFASVVLDMTIDRFSQPEYINDWIVYLLEEGEPEIMNAIDASVEQAGGNQAVRKQASMVENDKSASPVVDPENIRANHKRTVSRAEEAMDEAMKEAQRLTQLIIEEDERRQREQHVQTHQNRSQGKSIDESESSDTQPNGTHTPASTHTAESEPPISFGSPADKSLTRSDLSMEPSLQDDVIIEEPRDSAELSSGSGPSSSAVKQPAEPFTLHKAAVSIFDDGLSGEKRPSKTKPSGEYMISIEPANSAFPGWMIPRTYTDFETLHEILRRIANVSGVPFSKMHPELPSWKTLNKLRLRDELDRYLSDAMQFEQLAESEGMKRFLEKERGFRNGAQGKGFWPNPAQMGKGMFDALTKAPNQVAGGGKALLGGVANAFGQNTANKSAATKRSSVHMGDTKPVLMSNNSNNSSRMSFDSIRKPVTNGAPPSNSRMSVDARTNSSSTVHTLASVPPSNSLPPAVNERLESLASPDQPQRRSETPEMTLPPPPDMIADDYISQPIKTNKPRINVPEHTSQMSVDGTSFFDVPTPSSRDISPRPSSSRIDSPRGRLPPPPTQSASLKPPKAREQRIKQPLSEQEAQVTVELLFAVINELYTLSSAWNIRRTLLTAAKSFLLRPGNPQLESIRVLVQESVLDSNTSDAGIAAHLLKLRENSMPTEEELKTWPAPPTEEQKEALRIKARKLLVERGMPQALTSVMGAAASGEALGKVFDCLQVKDVARGVIFGLMLQSVKTIIQ